MFSAEEAAAFLTVIGIDLVLSGDNAIVIGAAAAGLSANLRHKAILFGIVVATATRLLFAMVAFYLLKIVGLVLLGGLLLLWVTWRLWRDLRLAARTRATPHEGGGDASGAPPAKTFQSAIIAIVLADVSMSLDNILAVAGAAKDHLLILMAGLILSIALMGVAANFIASVMDRYRWISYVGVALIFYVAMDMIWRGAHEVYYWASL